MVFIGFFISKMSDSLIPSFFVGDVSELLKSLTKNERMSELLVFFSAHLLIFLKKRAIHSENR